jgi:hypothetical protein
VIHRVDDVCDGEGVEGRRIRLTSGFGLSQNT